MAPSSDGYSRGFAQSDFNDVGWISSSLNNYSDKLDMTDDGKLLYVGSTYGTESLILERSETNPEGFVSHEINRTGLVSMRGPIESQKQIARNGNIVGSVNGTLSAIWPTGYSNEPIVGATEYTYRKITMSGLYAFGFDGYNLIRHDVVSATSESISAISYREINAIDWCGEKVISWSSIDLDERAVLFNKIGETWTEEIDGYLQATTATGDVDQKWPNIRDMSANGEIVVGDTSNNKALYWKMTDDPIGGVREAIALPDLTDSATYGISGYAWGISPDGTVIMGDTAYGYSCFWVGPTFDECFLLDKYLSEHSSGPQVIYNNDQMGTQPTDSYTCHSRPTAWPQVSYNGLHVSSISYKQPSAGPSVRSVLYCSPDAPLSIAQSIINPS